MAYSSFSVIKEQVINIVTPMHCNIFAHHVTHQFGIPNDTAPPAMPESVRVVGLANDDKVQTLVVEINGSIRRPDGGIYHLTVSTAEGIKPFASNKLLENGWKKITPVNIDVTPVTVNW